MLEAEQAMRGALAARSLADVHAAVARKAPAAFEAEVRGWLERRHAARGAGRRRTRGAPDRIP